MFDRRYTTNRNPVLQWEKRDVVITLTTDVMS